MMLRYALLILCAVLIWVWNTAPASAQNKHDQDIARARELLRLLVEEKYEALVGECNENVKQLLPPEKLKQAWTGFVGMFGPFVEELKATAKPAGDKVNVALDCRFKSGNLKISITLDANGKIAGLLFLPSSVPVPYEPPSYVDAGRFHEVDVTVSAGEFPLPGTLTIPKGAGPFPAVVLVHGSGSLAGDRDETVFDTKPFRDLAWGLATHGIAVLRYEKRSYKYPNVDPAKITIDTGTVDDALAAVRLLLERKGIDTKRVFLAGHSMGGIAAPYMASKEPRIAGIILLAAAARPMYAVGVDQTIRMAIRDGMVEEAELKLIEQAHDTNEALRDGTWKSREDFQGFLGAYLASHNKLAPVETAKSLTIPILIVQGGRDFQICPEKDYVMWRRALAGRENVTLKLFPRLDHLFHTGEGHSTLEQYTEKGYVDESVITCLADWIQAQE